MKKFGLINWIFQCGIWPRAETVSGPVIVNELLCTGLLSVIPSFSGLAGAVVSLNHPISKGVDLH